MLTITAYVRAARNAAVLAVFFSIPALGGSSSPSESQERPMQEPLAVGAASLSQESDLWTRDRLWCDWGGLKTDLESAGITLSLSYQHVLQVNMHGGLQTRNGHDIGGSYILGMELDLEKMLDLQGATFFMETKGTYGGDANDFDRRKIGGLFNTNQIADTDEWIFVNKWWYRQRLHDDRVEFRLGVIESFKDLFDVNKVAGSDEDQFTNRLLVGNPTIPHANAMGAYLNVWPTDSLYVRAMVVDPERSSRTTGFDTGLHGNANVRAFGELGLVPQFDSPNGKLLGHYRFGTWYDPVEKTEFRRFGRRTDSSDMGFYFGFDQVWWKENSDPKDKQGLSIFGRYGVAHGDVNRFEQFWSFGGQITGLIEGRDDDRLGFGFAQAIQSDEFHDNIRPRANRETVYEVYYAYQVSPWCVITPDLQFITNPGGDKDGRDAFVAGLRVRLWF